MMRPDQLDVQRACVLVIDIQEKLMPLIRRHEQIARACVKLLGGAEIFHLPIIATEQYPKGLGPTIAPIRERLAASGATVLEKPTFSAWADATVRQTMLSIDRPQIIVIGIEAHVCVQQTTIDLVSRDYDVFVCADAIGSRGPLDYEVALDRMRQANALITSVEAVLFELCQRCDTPDFKRMLEVIKASPPPEH